MNIPKRRSRFGDARLRDPARSFAERTLFSAFGVSDPAHYLHHRYVERLIDRWLIVSPRRILDAGCGRGDYSIWLSKAFPQAHVVGVDINEKSIERNQQTAARMGLLNVTFEVRDLAKYDCDEHFDLIVTVDVLEHVKDQLAAIRALRSVLLPGGLLTAHIPCSRPKPPPLSPYLKEFAAWAVEEHVADERTPEEFVKVFREAGFDLTEWKPTFSYWFGELATSLFNIPYRNTPLNRIAQVLLAPPARALAMLDQPFGRGPHYAIAIAARRGEEP